MKKNEIVITRIFEAPVELVWKYWTEPEYSKRWWAPKDFTCSVSKIDFKVGGKYFSCMRGKMPDGKITEVCSTGVYKEIIPLKKLVMSDSFADKKGNVVPASHYGFEGFFPMNLLITVTFENLKDKTKITLKHSGLEDVDDKMKSDMEQGWSQMFDKLNKIIK